MKEESILAFAKRHTNALITTTLPYLEQIISPFLTAHPYWQLAFHQAIGLYGYYMALKQEEVNEYVEFIKKHPEDFRKEIIESNEFRNGFVLAFQDYLKLRSKQKKEAAYNILLGFTKSSNKDEFQLERLDDALMKISSKSLSTLKFLKDTIVPLKETHIYEELKKQKIEESGKNVQWWFKLHWQREPIWKFTDKWLYDNYNPNSESVKKKYKVDKEWDKKLIDEVFEIEREKRREISEDIEELVNLGIMKLRPDTATYDSGGTYDLTKFGYSFIEYITK